MHPRWYHDRPPPADRGNHLDHRGHRVRRVRLDHRDHRGLFLPPLKHPIDRQTHRDRRDHPDRRVRPGPGKQIHRGHRGHDLGHRDHPGPRGRLASDLGKPPA